MMSKRVLVALNPNRKMDPACWTYLPPSFQNFLLTFFLHLYYYSFGLISPVNCLERHPWCLEFHYVLEQLWTDLSNIHCPLSFVTFSQKETKPLQFSTYLFKMLSNLQADYLEILPPLLHKPKRNLFKFSLHYHTCWKSLLEPRCEKCVCTIPRKKSIHTSLNVSASPLL